MRHSFEAACELAWAGLKPVALLALISCLWQVDRAVNSFRDNLESLKSTQKVISDGFERTAGQVFEAAFVAKRFVKSFEEEWESPASKLNRKHAMMLGDTSLAIAQAFKNETLPEITGTARSTNQLVIRVDQQINDDLLPEATRFLKNLGDTAEKLGKTSDEATKMVAELASVTGTTLQEARNLIASPEWELMIKDARIVTANAAKMTENGVLATENLVGSTEDIRKFTQATSKAQKVMLGIRILAGLAGLLAFF